MNYEQKYKEALERMKSWVRGEHPECFSEAQKAAEFIFPELAESEDEQSKKWILEYLYDGLRKSDEQFKGQFKAAIAWLEKQGEQKPNPVFDIEIPFGAKDSELQEASYYIPEGFHAEIDRNKVVIKRGEPANKVEPKFKVGDWVVYNYPYTISPICQIIAINENCIVELKDLNGKQFQTENHDLNTNYHLWTIADAKDGDILMAATPRNCPFIYRKTNYNNNLAYYYAGINGNGDFCEGCLKRRLYHFGPVANITPATKEQRDLLFRKMKEAGYKWDAKNKCLCTIN